MIKNRGGNWFHVLNNHASLRGGGYTFVQHHTMMNIKFGESQLSILFINLLKWLSTLNSH